mgnify:CR=1 FL=1
MFYDRAKIYVKAGNGGNGAVAFRREKFVPEGGPFGGNGGRGGHLYLIVDPNMNTLSHYRQRIHHRAQNGTNGSGANKTGAYGEDLYLPVPPGTVVFNDDTDEQIADLVTPGQKILLLDGGRAGRGNSSFKSARNTAPRMAEKGEEGGELWIRLELKLVADIGIIGVPNAGKSTLLSVVSGAKPKIADYPFTTIVPNLGVAEVDHDQIVLADIPGLMEGAHEGIGLGLDFLRHIERTRVLIHLLNGDSPDPLGDYEAINQELILFNPQLAERPQIVVLNKMDLPHAREQWPEVEAKMKSLGQPTMAISAVTQENVQQLLYEVKALLDALPENIIEPAEELPEITPAVDENAFEIEITEEGVYRVEGVGIERVVQMTNWTYYESTLRFQRILRAMGITAKLEEMGIKDDDIVEVGDMEMVWGYENALDD